MEKKPSQKRVGGVAYSVHPEFKPHTTKKPKKTKNQIIWHVNSSLKRSQQYIVMEIRVKVGVGKKKSGSFFNSSARHCGLDWNVTGGDKK
jgi:hypothetical protein